MSCNVKCHWIPTGALLMNILQGRICFEWLRRPSTSCNQAVYSVLVSITFFGQDLKSTSALIMMIALLKKLVFKSHTGAHTGGTKRSNAYRTPRGPRSAPIAYVNKKLRHVQVGCLLGLTSNLSSDVFKRVQVVNQTKSNETNSNETNQNFHTRSGTKSTDHIVV